MTYDISTLSSMYLPVLYDTIVKHTLLCLCACATATAAYTAHAADFFFFFFFLGGTYGMGGW